MQDYIFEIEKVGVNKLKKLLMLTVLNKDDDIITSICDNYDVIKR